MIKNYFGSVLSFWLLRRRDTSELWEFVMQAVMQNKWRLTQNVG